MSCPETITRLNFGSARGDHRLFDVTPYMDRGVFTKLKDLAHFKQAYVAFNTVCWPDNLDIAPETLFDRSVSLGED